MKISFIKYEKDYQIPKLLGMNIEEIKEPEEIDNKIEELKNLIQTQKRKRLAERITNRVICTIGIIFAIPRLISVLSEKLYTTSLKKPIFDEDWTSEYVKVKRTKGKEHNDNGWFIWESRDTAGYRK